LAGCVGLRGLVRWLAITVYQFGKHHQPLRRGANVIRGITGDQRQLRVVGRLDHADIFRHHNSLTGDFISKSAAAASDLYLVALVELVDMAEKCIAMGRDHRVSRLAGLGGLLHVSGAFGKFPSRGAFHHNCVHLNLGNLQTRQHLVG
jgi:hypothetical protein